MRVMDLLFFLALSAAVVALMFRLFKWAERADTEARGHERIRSRRERGRLEAKFLDIVSDIRKPRD